MVKGSLLRQTSTSRCVISPKVTRSTFFIENGKKMCSQSCVRLRICHSTPVSLSPSDAAWSPRLPR